MLPASSPLAVFRTSHLWTWVAVLASLIVCATLAHLRFEEARTIQDAARTMQNIGNARVYLAEGLLHATLAGDMQTLFRRQEGIAQIDQAIASLREAGKEGIAGHAIILHGKRSWAEFDRTAATFRATLAEWDRAQGPDRPAIALRIHLSFHELERYASQIDEESQASLDALTSALHRRFAFAIGISTVLLCGICGGIYWTGRVQRAAVLAMRESEERLRILSDSLPNGYIAQFVLNSDGAASFGYVSAGVERVHKITAAECQRDAEPLLSLMYPAQRKAFNEAVAASARDLTDFEMDLSFRHPDGDERIVHVRSHPVRRPGGLVRWDGLVLDVTEHHRAEERLRKNEELLRQMGRTAKVGGWEFDPATGKGEWTEEVARIHDLEPGKPANRELGLSFYTHESRLRIQAALQGAIEQAKPYDLELELISAKDVHKWVRTIGVPEMENGRVVRVRGSFQDITDLKQAEEALRRQQQNYREIFNAVTDAIFVHDAATGAILDVNDSMLRMYGFASTQEVLSLRSSHASTADLPPFDRAEARHRIQLAVTQGTQVFDWLTRRKDGSPFWVEVSLRPARIDGQERVLASVRDISVRKWHELEIERLTRLYSTLSAVNQMIVRCQTREELFGEACRILVEFGKLHAVWIGLRGEGSPPLTVAAYRCSGGEAFGNWNLDCGMIGEMLETAGTAICNSPDSPCKACWREAAPEMDIQSAATFPLRLRGEVIAALVLLSTERDFFSAEEIRLLTEVADDISFALGRMDEQAQQRLVQAERTRLITAMEQAAELIVITDVQGRILYVNPAFEKVTGYSRDEVLGQNPRILQSGTQDKAYYRVMWTTLARGDVWHGRFINKKKNGETYEEDASISPIRNEEGKIVHYVAVKRDVTREVELEAQFRQAQKMEGIGQLAGGVAHDFNNILAAIMLQAQLSENTPGVPVDAAEGMRQIQHSCERGANLTRQLLLFSRKQTMQPQALDLNESVTNITKMIQRIIGESVRIQRVPHARPLIVHADAGMLDQVILNLAINGRDAMEGRGTLTIETSEKQVDAETASLNPDAAPGLYACLSIGDTGCGIPPEILPRIFEPFFTTKEQGKGTGLGLATVFGIVKQHKGWIHVRTEQGKGTTFEVYLPAYSAAPRPAGAAETASKLPCGAETILLAEDDADVRTNTRKLLELYGYRVLEACDGVDALTVWRKHEGRVDLLLTDLLMPRGINGHDLSQRLRALKPGLKVAYLSGYAADLDEQGLELRAGENFLQKPVMPSQLLSLVRRQFRSGQG